MDERDMVGLEKGEVSSELREGLERDDTSTPRAGPADRLLEEPGDIDLEKGELATEPQEVLERDDPSTSRLCFGPTEELRSSIGEPQRNEKRKRSTAFLDGLRGLAAFLVYMSHHTPWWYDGNKKLNLGYGYHGEKYFATLPFIRSLFTGGSAAVAIFFVLSGYVLSIGPLRMLRQRKHQRIHPPLYRSLLSAFIRRPLRLFFPVAAVSLAFALMMHLPFGLAPHLEWPVPEKNIFWELITWVKEMFFIMNVTEKHGPFTRWFQYDPPAYTMPIEWLGSMLVYAALTLFSFAPAKYRMALFSISGLILFATYQWAMALFMAGIALALNDLEGIDVRLLAKGFSGRTKTIAFNVIFFLGWWILSEPAGEREPERSYNTPGWYYLTMLIPGNYFNDEYYRFWNVIGAVMLVYGVLRLRWLQAFFNTRPLQYLGRISFSFYLLHIPIEWTIGDSIYRLLGKVRQDFTTSYDGLLAVPDKGPLGLSTGFLLAQMFIFPLTVLMAEAGTRLLDEPSVRAGKWVVARLGLNKESSRHQR